MNDKLRIDSKDIIEKLKSELNKTKMERDYARREVCKAESSGRIGRFGTAQDHAERMGWDCFESDTLSQEVSQEGCKEKQ
jgi:peptide subunit release factor 1 (eRF1)